MTGEKSSWCSKFRRRVAFNRKGDGRTSQDRQVALPASTTVSPPPSQAGGCPMAGPDAYLNKAEALLSTTEPPSRHSLSSLGVDASSIGEPDKRLPMPPSAAEEAPCQRAATPTTPKWLWDRAYDHLRRDEPKLVQCYETILSYELEGVENNVIGQDPTERQSQISRLLDAGLDKTAKLASVEKDVSAALAIILSIKDAIGIALQAVPVAPMVWTGVCVALQVLQNPSSEMTASRNGIVQVVQKMKWYSSLPKLLPLDDTPEHDVHLAELRPLLADRILNLYRSILRYIAKSVCADHRHPALRFSRDLFKLDDWSGSLGDVDTAEESVKVAVEHFGVRQANSYLGLLAKIRISREQEKMMHQLCVTDMAAEVESLQNRKDQLLADSYKWILDNQDYKDFVDWHHGDTKRVLWIKGDAGKGKTMLLIGIIHQLTAQLETHFNKPHLSYFFCQGTNNKLNTATAILRGLIWMLLRQERSLIHHLDDFKDRGQSLFEARVAFYNLKGVLQSMLEDEALKQAYFVVDALDECNRDEPGLRELLKLISETSAKCDKVKWLVSSRSEPLIEADMKEHMVRTRLSLELNAESVAGAVRAYIDFKMSELDERYRKTYADRGPGFYNGNLRRLRDEVAEEILLKADGTFLWVALVFKHIEECDADTVLEHVRVTPSGLNNLYAQMMERIGELRNAANCNRVLMTMVNTYRPLHLSELRTLAGLSELAADRKIVQQCSLLTIKEDEDIVYFIHQSAKDFLTRDNTAGARLQACEEVHQRVFLQSIDAMSQKLRQNVYDLPYPGFSVNTVNKPDPDPLEAVRYSCVYWADHFGEMGDLQRQKHLSDSGEVYSFLKECLLYWLEALGLLGSLSKGIHALMKLEALVRVDSSPKLCEFLRDARRMSLYNRSSIEETPLQLYSSALIFAPENSIVRRQFANHIPNWINKMPNVRKEWSPLLQSLDLGVGKKAFLTAFSPDGKLLASALNDYSIRIWDVTTGASLQTLRLSSNSRIGQVAVSFSPDSKLVASALNDGSVCIWDATTGDPRKLLDAHLNYIGPRAVGIVWDGKLIASNGQVRDAKSGATQHTYPDWVIGRVLSPDGKLVASPSDGSIRIRDGTTGATLNTLNVVPAGMLSAGSRKIDCTIFSPDGKLIVTVSPPSVTVKIWDTSTGAALQTLYGGGGSSENVSIETVAFSQDGKLVAFVMQGSTIPIWDIATRTVLQTLDNNSHHISCVTFSPDSKLLTSASPWAGIKIWDLTTSPPSGNTTSPLPALGDSTAKLEDTATGVALQPRDDSFEVLDVAVSPDGKLIASVLHDGTVQLWDTATGDILLTFQVPSVRRNAVGSSVSFSPNGKLVASVSGAPRTANVWDAFTGANRLTTLSYGGKIVFSPDSKLVALSAEDSGIQLWDTALGVALLTIGDSTSYKVTFSPDSKLVASESKSSITIWNAATGHVLQTCDIDPDRRGTLALAFAPDCHLATHAVDDYDIIGIRDGKTGATWQMIRGHDHISAIAFSPGGELVASASGKTVNIRDAATGTALETITVDTWVRELAFSQDGPYLETEDGRLAVRSLATPAASPRTTIFLKDNWVARNMENYLWLPPEYRTYCRACSQNTVVLRHGSGRLAIVEIT